VWGIIVLYCGVHYSTGKLEWYGMGVVTGSADCGYKHLFSTIATCTSRGINWTGARIRDEEEEV